jgi:hypothetical protein
MEVHPLRFLGPGLVSSIGTADDDLKSPMRRSLECGYQWYIRWTDHGSCHVDDDEEENHWQSANFLGRSGSTAVMLAVARWQVCRICARVSRRSQLTGYGAWNRIEGTSAL